MKQALTMFLLILCAFSVSAQHSIFVLVDVSKSISQNQLIDARQALTEVLNASSLSKAFVSQGNQQDLTQFKLAVGDSVSISKFGGLETTLAISPNPIVIQSVNANTDQLVNSIEWTPTDNETYIVLAKAKIAEYAKKHAINNYRLYVVSDNIQDDYGPNGRPNYPNDYTRNLVEGYNSSTNGVQESGYTKIKFSASSLYTLSFSPGVNINRYLPGSSGSATAKPPVSQRPTSPAMQASSTITLTSFVDGKKDAPKSTSSNSFTISWICNCTAGTSFYVLLSEVDGGKYKEQKKNITTNSVKFNDVPSGVFKITVSASSASSAITFVDTPGGGIGWIVFLLIATIAGGSIYYLWNKKRHEKINQYTTNNDDIFSGRNNSGATTGSSSSYDDY